MQFHLKFYQQKNGLKGYSLGQLLFGYDIILLIKYKVDWELIRQINQAKYIEDNIREYSKIVYHNYKVRDKYMFPNNAAHRY